MTRMGSTRKNYKPIYMVTQDKANNMIYIE